MVGGGGCLGCGGGVGAEVVGQWWGWGGWIAVVGCGGGGCSVGGWVGCGMWRQLGVAAAVL